MEIHEPKRARGRAWKMVDIEAADAVASGSLRIGTMASYSELENGRADRLDGALLAHVPSFTGSGADGAAGLGRFGKVIAMTPNTTLEIHDVVFEERVTPYWLFCMTRPGNAYNPEPDKPKAMFEIADLDMLGMHLLRRFTGQQLGGKAWSWHVEYQPRLLTLTDALQTAARPWLKDPLFAREEEIRLAFSPTNPGACMGKFDTGPDPDIAKMLTRIF